MTDSTPDAQEDAAMTTPLTSDQLQAEMMRRAGPAFLFDPATLFRDILTSLTPYEASVELSRFSRKCDTNPDGDGWIVRAMCLDEQTLALRRMQLEDEGRRFGMEKTE